MGTFILGMEWNGSGTLSVNDIRNGMDIEYGMKVNLK